MMKNSHNMFPHALSHCSAIASSAFGWKSAGRALCVVGVTWRCPSSAKRICQVMMRGWMAMMAMLMVYEYGDNGDDDDGDCVGDDGWVMTDDDGGTGW